MENFIVLIFGMFFMFIVMLILREVYCWYAKINERIALMEKQLDQSKETNRLLTLLIQEAKPQKTNHINLDKAAILELSGETPKE